MQPSLHQQELPLTAIVYTFSEGISFTGMAPGGARHELAKTITGPK